MSTASGATIKVATETARTAAKSATTVTHEAWDKVTRVTPWTIPRFEAWIEALLLGALVAVVAIVVIAPHFERGLNALIRVWGQVFTGYLPPLDKKSLKGRTCVVTGANIGVGKATVEHLVRCGASRVVMACRSMDRASQARDDIRSTVGPELADACALDIVPLDLADLSSVSAFPRRLTQAGIDTVDVLINNAGLMMVPGHTKDGHEMHVGTNHLGHFHLTKVLLPLFSQTSHSRIIVLASVMHHAACLDHSNVERANVLTSDISLPMGYNVSKLCNVLFARELARQLRDAGSPIEVFIADPGTVQTNITNNIGVLHDVYQKVGHWFVRSPREGAWTSAWLATSRDVAGRSGKYYVNCREGQVSPAGGDDVLAQILWEKSEEWTGSRFDIP